MGASDEGGLTQALSMQLVNGRKRLLGEILIEFGWDDERTIRRAIPRHALFPEE